MKVVILNWSKGENDPFTFYSQNLKRTLEEYGKVVTTVDISKNDSVRKILDLAGDGIDFVLTYQGLGTATEVNTKSGKINLWDLLKVPLIALHGDHPCHHPINHYLDRPYCLHQYNSAQFTRYANKNIRKIFAATYFVWPILFRESILDTSQGKSFVIVKNITDPARYVNNWVRQKNSGNDIASVCLMAQEVIGGKLQKYDCLDLHEEIDKIIMQQDWQSFDISKHAERYHFLHRELDFYFESYRAVLAINQIKEFPVKIFGRGWGFVAERCTPGHEFHGPRNMDSSQDLFYSEYGLIDLCPAGEITDRARRAIANRQPFISNAYLRNRVRGSETYDNLFFDFKINSLEDCCERIISAPKEHKELTREFGDFYSVRFSEVDFVEKLTNYARILRASFRSLSSAIPSEHKFSKEA